MVRISAIFSALALAALVTLAGCNNTKKDDKKSLPEAPKFGANDKKNGDKVDSKEAEITKALAALSDEDRAAAEKQRDCPISGERLGSMDTPIKVTLNGEEVFLCCEGCKADAEADPDATLAKVKK